MLVSRKLPRPCGGFDEFSQALQRFSFMLTTEFCVCFTNFVADDVENGKLK
jgi:hypothetical protein